ncbi:MAG: ABC transporter ATP-binding protein [Acidobacteria bacterium]|nr:ABC transporter ATP-binding protein [Acidobacteriota bacterium]MBU4306668.1 ABC transporter ATP-binding protein [Acidobacteriota bacterium]MBU4405704.1 ABC transporter ATP-binding protein [Acidobacteriota bacterium]
MTAVLKAEKLSKWYGNILGISDINLEIGSGITGLLGPNGAGKSTFLKIAAGQLKPKIGSLTVFGAAVFGNHRLFRRIGFCPEHDSAYMEMSGWQFILLLARLHGFDRNEAGAMSEKALATVGLLESKDREIKGYSFGMRQRLRLASSILHEPEMLMLDEPLRGVDPLWRIKIMKLIKDYGKQGRTVIISSHILPEIEAMTSEIVLIHQGKIFAKGDIHRIRGLIDSHPHQVSIRCLQPRQLAQKLIDSDFVLSVDFDKDGHSLTVKTNQRDLFFTVLIGLIAESGLEIEEITSPDDNLQAVFDYLIGK